jgi:hypothetical protein
MVLKVMMLLSFLILSACVSKNPQSLSNSPEAEHKTPQVSEEQQERKTEISPDVLFLLMAVVTTRKTGKRTSQDPDIVKPLLLGTRIFALTYIA